tara:strand:- start:688 stop:1746 length:1059 start_codon:yes stop_codon:yes gene_type:complete
MSQFGIQPSRLGQQNLAGDQNTLFLKVFAGEVLSVFEETNVMMPLHTVRTISSGKSAQFPAMATANASYHTPGESVLQQNVGYTGEDDGVADNLGATNINKYLSRIKHSEVVITINDLLQSSTFIANIDEAKNHYDVRSEYSRQMGFALANKADKMLILHGLTGARRATDRFGGTDYIGASVNTGDGSDAATPAEILDGIFDAAQAFDEKDVPSADRYCVLAPREYYGLVNGTSDAINRDYGNDGNGSVASGMIMSVAGIRIVKSNHLAQTSDYAAEAGDNSSLSNTDFTGSGKEPAALIFQRSALGTVKLLDLAVESDYQVERQGTLMVAKYAMGHDTLRTEALYELKQGA